MRSEANPPAGPSTVRTWNRHHPAEQAGILLDLAQQDTIGGMATQSYALRHAFTRLCAPARHIAGYLLAAKARHEPGPRSPWRWRDLPAHRQRTMLKEIANWSVEQWTSHRERPPEVRSNFRELSRQAFAVCDRLAARRLEVTR